MFNEKNRHFDRDEKYETFHFPNKVINLYSDAERVYKIELSDGAVYAAAQYIKLSEYPTAAGLCLQ